MLLAASRLCAEDIAERDDIDLRAFDEIAHVVAAAFAAADEAELDALIGAVHPGIRKRGGSARAAQECPAWDIVFRHTNMVA